MNFFPSVYKFAGGRENVIICRAVVTSTKGEGIIKLHKSCTITGSSSGTTALDKFGRPPASIIVLVAISWNFLFVFFIPFFFFLFFSFRGALNLFSRVLAAWGKSFLIHGSVCPTNPLDRINNFFRNIFFDEFRRFKCTKYTEKEIVKHTLNYLNYLKGTFKNKTKPIGR